MAKHTVDRWADLQKVRGVRVFATSDELSNAQKAAVLSRNPNNCLYRPAGDRGLYDKQKYGRLNGRLHDNMEATARKHFKDVLITDDYPQGGVDSDFLQSIGTAFTYQNSDWYGPSYECYIGVLCSYLSATLLIEFQHLLVGDLAKWCIVVVLCQDSSFGEGPFIYLFSDQALIDPDAAALLQLKKPKKRKRG
jgi:hypothetical protein